MLRVLVLFLLYTTPLISLSQELNSKVLVNTDKLQSSEKLLFEEMQTNIEQFLNSQIWTNDKFNSQEKINCNFIINIINQPSSNQYEATVQIVSSRPIYNSSYETILLNHGDREWIFEYFPSQTIEFVENGFNDNLTSLLSFYAYLIIGIDYDSFEKLGGEEYFQKAWKILNESIFHSFTHFDLELKIMISKINEYPNDVYLEPLNSSILKSLPTVMKKGVALVIDNHII